MTLVLRARIAAILAICLLMLASPAAMASPLYGTGAEIRLGSGSYIGDNVVNRNATHQTVTNSGVVGQTLTFWIRITNDGALPDTFKVKRSCCFHEGYRVRYRDANGTDVTGQVTLGTFTTPVLAADGGQYEMRATVRVRALATPGSTITRLLTVTSVGNSSLKDAVRFVAGMSSGAPNTFPIATDDVNAAAEDSPSSTVTGNVIANDIDPDADTLVASLLTPVPLYGFLTLNPDGSYIYTVNNLNGTVDGLGDGQSLTDAFAYLISDGKGGLDAGVLTVTIHGWTDSCVVC